VFTLAEEFSTADFESGVPISSDPFPDQAPNSEPRLKAGADKDH
jgi:hypothetical protein